MNHLVQFENFVREGILNEEHEVYIFFDVENAYEFTWQYDIMNDCYDMDLWGSLPLFILKKV